jgi:hemoglobin
MTETVFEQVGGEDFFVELVGHFYDAVERDEVLLALYPEPLDLAPARWRLTWFLVQYFGGPTVYSDARGHPRLRARHFPFAIGPDERDRWLAAMAHALDSVQPNAQVRAAIWDYAVMAAEAMRNQD